MQHPKHVHGTAPAIVESFERGEACEWYSIDDEVTSLRP